MMVGSAAIIMLCEMHAAVVPAIMTASTTVRCRFGSPSTSRSVGFACSILHDSSVRKREGEPYRSFARRARQSGMNVSMRALKRGP